MKLRLSILSLILASSLTVNAQASYTFKVLSAKGSTEIKSGGNWQPIKVGTLLKDADEVRVGDNSYLGLHHATGKGLEVRDAGTFKVTDLASRVKPGASVLNKYTDFILSSNTEKKNRLSATGAVHRGIGDVIMLYLPGSDKAEVLGDYVGLQWSALDVKGPYEIIVNSLLEDELAKIETTENQYILDLTKPEFKGQYELLIKVVSKSDRSKGSKDYIVKRLRPSAREKYATLVNEIKDTSAEQSALNKYVLAGIYEQNYLLIDALTAYQEAIKLAPDVSTYKEEYNEFLKRLGFELK